MVVFTRGAAFDMDWWKFGVFQCRYYNITHIFLRPCMYRYGILEGTRADVTTTAMAKAILRLKTLAFTCIPS